MSESPEPESTGPRSARRDFLAAALAAGAAATVAASDVARAPAAAAQPPPDTWRIQEPSPDVIDANEAASITPTGDVVPDLQKLIDDTSAQQGGGDIALSVAGDYGWGDTLSLKSNVRLFLGGGVRLVASASLNDMITTAAGAENCAVIGGEFDANNNVNGAIVGVSNGFKNISVTTRMVNTNGAANSPTMGVRLGQGSRAAITGCEMDGLFLNVRVDQAVTDLVMRDCHVSNMAERGNMIQLFGEVNRVWIENNVCTGNRLDAIGGHYIQSSGEMQGHNHRNVWIIGNYMIGPDIAFTQASDANGASGDMIACRSMDGFVVADNIVRNSGEYGITVVHGCKNGVVKGNIVTDADGSAIIVGTGPNRPIRNVLVHHNVMVRSGRDRAQELGRVASAAVRFWNAINCAFTDNLIDGYTRNGLYLYSPPEGEEPTLLEFHHANNRYIPEPGSEGPVWDIDTENGGPGRPNWTEALVI